MKERMHIVDEATAGAAHGAVARAPREVTVADLDAVRAAIIAGGGYRREIDSVAQSVDWLARTAINALIGQGWRPDVRSEATITEDGQASGMNKGDFK